MVQNYGYPYRQCNFPAQKAIILLGVSRGHLIHTFLITQNSVGAGLGPARHLRRFNNFLQPRQRPERRVGTSPAPTPCYPNLIVCLGGLPMGYIWQRGYDAHIYLGDGVLELQLAGV